jgi:quercetin dioxygenase-like cupin family protein
MPIDQVRRVVTGHDAAGRAVITADGLLDSTPTPAGASRLTLVWTTSGLPVDNTDPTDGRDRDVGLALAGGSVLRVVDLLPGKSAPMHRTSSLDFGIVIAGQIELLLDDDVVTRLDPGDIVVQRGTIHGWRNPSEDTTSRVAFALLDATPVSVNGVPLPDIHPGAVPPSPPASA